MTQEDRLYGTAVAVAEDLKQLMITPNASGVTMSVAEDVRSDLCTPAESTRLTGSNNVGLNEASVDDDDIHFGGLF
jgi:hypothetical protein